MKLGRQGALLLVISIATSGCSVLLGQVARRWRTGTDANGQPHASRVSQHPYRDGLGDEHSAELVVACRDGLPAMTVRFAHPLTELRARGEGMEAKAMMGIGQGEAQWTEVWGSVEADPRHVALFAKPDWSAMDSAGVVGFKTRILSKRKPVHVTFKTDGIAGKAKEVAGGCASAPSGAASDAAPPAPNVAAPELAVSPRPAPDGASNGASNRYDAWPD